MSALMEDIKEAVLAVLPSLPEDKVQMLLNNLASIGVESKSDLQFIKEEDLLASITPIQCRKLLSAWQTLDQTEYVTLTAVDHSDIVLSTTTEDTPSSESENTTASSSNASRMSVNLSLWHENFSVPWNRMPPGIATAISLEKRPSAKDRREMVRILVDEMRLNEPNPSKSQCQTIAKMIVKQHPKSFADVMRDGTVIGSGYGSFLTQLKTRVEHLNRGNTLSRRRKPKRVSDAPEDIARGPADQYGCVRWQPNCPPGETVEGLEEKKSEMKDLYHTEGPAGAERGYVIQLMKTTYYLQRKYINACPPPSVSELKSEWPYLFFQRELYSHFNLLTDINILGKMEQAIEEKGKLILRFFQHRPAGTSADEVERILVKYSKEEKCDPCSCVILLLMAHFKEKSEGLILQTDVFSTAVDVERTILLPASPRLIVLGDFLTATNWMLSIEGHVVVGPYQNIVAGLAALFACYYVFNLVYQEEASNTLEFIQRCFLGINPTSGTKATKWISPRSGKVQEKRSSNVNLHVSALLKRLMDFEWL